MDRDQPPDHDLFEDLDVPLDDDLDLPPVDTGDGSGGIRPPDERTGGGGGGRGGPGPDPFLQSRWAAMVPAGLILLFGLQSLLVLWVSRTGLGSEGVAWMIAALFVISFTVVFILGSRFIARHRH